MWWLSSDKCCVHEVDHMSGAWIDKFLFIWCLSFMKSQPYEWGLGWETWIGIRGTHGLCAW
jgi:hypothetical protein